MSECKMCEGSGVIQDEFTCVDCPDCEPLSQKLMNEIRAFDKDKPKPASDLLFNEIKNTEAEIKALTQAPQKEIPNSGIQIPNLGSEQKQFKEMILDCPQCGHEWSQSVDVSQRNSASETTLSQKQDISKNAEDLDTSKTHIEKQDEPHKFNQHFMKAAHAQAWTREQVFAYAYQLGLQQGHINEANAIRVEQKQDEPCVELIKAACKSAAASLDPSKRNANEDLCIAQFTYGAHWMERKLQAKLAEAEKEIEAFKTLQLMEKIAKDFELLSGIKDIPTGQWAYNRIKELEAEVAVCNKSGEVAIETLMKEVELSNRYKTALEKIAVRTNQELNDLDWTAKQLRDIAKEALKEQREG